MLPRNYDYLGLWKCDNCLTDDLVNTQLHCPNCGAPIVMCEDGTPDTRRPNPEDIQRYIIRDEQILARIARKEGVWECRFCDSVHLDENNFCDSCGASKEGIQYALPENSVPEVATSTTLFSTDYGSSTSAVSNYHTNEPARPSSYDFGLPATEYQSKPRISLNLRSTVIGLLVAALIVVGMIWAYREFIVRITYPATIESVSWSRVIPVEVYRWIDADNQTGCPSNSRNCSSGREVIGQEQYQSGTVQVDDYSYRTVEDPPTCTDSKNPDGSYSHRCTSNSHQERYVSGSHSEPVYSWRDVYGTVYRYEIQSWVWNRNLGTSGNDWNPYWESEYTLGTQSGETERLSTNTSETYSILLVTSEGERHTWSSSNESEWRAFESGEASFEVIINGNGGLVSAGRHQIQER